MIPIEKTVASFAREKNLAESKFDKFTSMEIIPSTIFDQMLLAKSKIRCHDTQYNDTQHNDT
jgi:hypothetical protein